MKLSITYMYNVPNDIILVSILRDLCLFEAFMQWLSNLC